MSDIEIKLAGEEDKKYLIEWLQEPEILRWFPMCDEKEIEDAARIWMSYARQKAVFMALYKGRPCGIANLYLQTFLKFRHQCLFAIIVAAEYRNKGIGTALMEELMRRAREEFNIELLHLEVYEGNPAKRLYERLGFEEFGFQKNFLKEESGRYLGKIFMQKRL